MPGYTYRPKTGDVVIFPNGIELNYLEAEGTVYVMAPEGQSVIFHAATSQIGVTQ